MSYALSAIGAHTMQREGPRKCVQRDSESETYHVGVSPGMIDVGSSRAALVLSGRQLRFLYIVFNMIMCSEQHQQQVNGAKAVSSPVLNGRDQLQQQQPRPHRLELSCNTTV